MHRRMFGLLALSLCFMLTTAVPLAREDSVESARATLAAAANGMGSGGLGGVIAAAEVACTSDSATVFCATKPATIDKFYANIASGCSCFYRCTPGGSFAYTCQSPTLFNEAQQQCDWPANVACTPRPPSPPSPRPPPRPKPRPPSPKPKPPKPKPPHPRPSPPKPPPKPPKPPLPPRPRPKPRPPPRPRPPPMPRPPKPRPPKPRPPPPRPRPPRPPPPKPRPPPRPRPPPSPPSPPGPPFRFAAYYESWADPWAGDAASSTIASLPSYANIICLSFMLPDSSYHGGITFAGTGLSFSSEPAVIRAAIALLKQRRPNTKVLISVGGATYPNWSKLNATAVASFVKAFGLDGVDIDFEGEAGCTRGIGGKVSCQSDVPYTQAISKLRAVLPRPYLIATAAWSIGAYGEGAWANSMPQGANTGMLINVLKNAGSQLDYVFVMSYDAGDANTTGYNPVEAIQAYCSYHPCNRVLGGIQIPPEAWGGAETTVAEAEAFGLKMKQMGAGGVMMWAAFKTGPPSAQQLAQAACRSLALGGCTSSLVG